MSHFRSSSLTSNQDSLYAFTFTGQQSFRTSFFGGITVGTITTNGDFLNFGDGAGAQIFLRVLAVNSAEDYFVGEIVDGTGAPITHTYASVTANYEAFFESNARVTTNDQFSNQTYRAEVTVNAGILNEAPNAAVPPIIQVADNSVFTYQLVATDADNDALTFRIGTAGEFIGNSFGTTFPPTLLVAPAGVTLSASGLLTWDVRDMGGANVTAGQRYTMTAVVSDGQATTPIDFIFDIVSTVNNQAPVFTIVPGDQSLTLGTSSEVAVVATDPNGNLVSIQVLNPPAGLTTDYHADEGELHIEFTPQTGGSYIVNIVATDSLGLTTQTSITYNVNANAAPILDLNGVGAGTGTTITFTENAAATAIAPGAEITDQSADLDGGVLTVTLSANAGAGDQLVVLNQGNGAGQIGVAGNVVSYGGVAIGTVTGNGSAGTLTVTLSGTAATPVAADALVGAIGYVNTSDTPSTAARTVTFTLTDGDGGTSLPAEATINVVAVDDAATARPDSFVTFENVVLTGNLAADNGAGADSDADGVQIATVNGSAAAVGQTIVLSSGASLTVQADGTFAYNGTTAFSYLPLVTSGASNIAALDSFTYTVVGGSGAIVTVRINGIDNNDLLFGTAGSDTLVGGIGNDTLIALGGVDISDGGPGNDIHVMDDARDDIVERVGQGNDIVFSNTSYGLSAGVEVETLSTRDHVGTEAVGLAGNEFAQTLIGNYGDNLLEGAGGADTYVGLRGNDIYAISDSASVIVEGAGEGTDTVFASVSYTLGANASIETLSARIHAGTEAINLTGNAVAQTIIGNYGDNVLIGGGSADTMLGLFGNDVFVVSDSGTVIVEQAGQGSDVVFVQQSYALTADAEIETLSTQIHGGTTAIDLTGNGFGQTVIGNFGANTLDGGLGADSLIGLDGADSFAFTSALGDGNIDTLIDFASGIDRIVLDDAVFAGLAPGALAPGAFVAGSAATAATASVIFDSQTSSLWFDADGTGSAAAVQFATTAPGATIVATDFVIV